MKKLLCVTVEGVGLDRDELRRCIWCRRVIGQGQAWESKSSCGAGGLTVYQHKKCQARQLAERRKRA